MWVHLVYIEDMISHGTYWDVGEPNEGSGKGGASVKASPNMRLELTPRVEYGMNLSSARRSSAAPR